MTDDEWDDRRERIKNTVIASNNRVHDFIELIAVICATRTRNRKLRAETPQRELVYDRVNETRSEPEECRV